MAVDRLVTGRRRVVELFPSEAVVTRADTHVTRDAGARRLQIDHSRRSGNENLAVALLVVTGPPGAGKSTVAEVLAQHFEPSALVAGDELFASLRRGALRPWLPGSDDQNIVVTRAAASAAGVFAAGGYTTIYDGVVGPWFLDTFAQASGLESLEYVVLLPGEDRCVARVATRRNHGFTDEGATRRMHRQFATRSSDVESRHLVVEPPENVDQLARLILDGVHAGRFIHHVRESTT